MLRTLRSMLGGGLAHGEAPEGNNLGRGAALGVVVALFCLGDACSTNAKADRIRLRTGETVKGKLIPDSTVKGRVLLFRETGKTPMTLTMAQVVQVDPQPSILDDYAVERARLVPTAQSEFDLGEWCVSKGLKDLAAGHFEAAIKRDPKMEAAHDRLGHVQKDGKWLTQEQARSAGGMVYFKGKWITPEEAEQKKQEDSASAEQTSWQRRLGVMMRSYRAGPENRRHDVETQLAAIKDVAAITPILKTFGAASEPELRVLAARTLSTIPTPEAASALVTRLLAESDSEVREATLQELAKRDDPIVIRRLTTALGGKSAAQINRAAWTLGQLKAVETVPKLVTALVSVEERMIWIDPANQGTGYSGGGMIPQGQGALVAGGTNIPVLTGPAVAPGAVAFGATSVPAYDFYSGMNPSLGGPNRGPIPKMQTFTRQNTEVLNSLKTLTGQDFGYDVASWKRWVSQAYQPDPAPVRRVPEP